MTPTAAPKTHQALLDVRDLHAWYGDSYILQGMSFEVARGECITLLGRNGAGKTTTLRAIMGLVPRTEGSIRFDGKELRGKAPHQVARAGIAWCPEERGIFASLSVAENMTLPPVIADDGMPLERIYKMFPNLVERRASQGSKLSGGEQQMLAIGRILRTGARFLLLDEPTEGLAPVIVQQIRDVVLALKQTGMTIVLVEQNLHLAYSLADRHYVVEGGQVIDMIPGADLKNSDAKIRQYLGV
jgi:branched-chain amino acid transport system ATP-binding protein